MKQATKQKLLPVGYSNGIIIRKNYRKKFNTIGFVDEKLQKSTRITLQYSIVNRRVTEFLSKNITFFSIIFFDDAAIPCPTGSSFCLVARFIISVSKMDFKKTLWVYQISPIFRKVF